MNEKADCHCHTLFSDGSLNPVALLDLAKEQQLSGLSITDHDTIGAYDTALPYAKTLGITLVSGIEISAEHQRTSIHVLGYAFDLNNPDLQDFCLRLQADREQRNQKILEKLAALKMPITIDELKAKFPHGTLGRPHIAKMMIAKGFVRTAKQAFDRYLGNKSRCYVSGLQVEVEVAIELVQRAGGFAVLAHPHYLPKHVATQMLTKSFDGVEGHYGHLSLKQEQPWLDIAKEKSWLITGGSDFHGEKKSFHALGCSFTPSETFARFVERFTSH